MCAMSDGTQGPIGADSDGEGKSVLQNLPRTRPQRASPRRAAARRSAARKTGPERPKAQAAEANGSVSESAAGDVAAAAAPLATGSKSGNTAAPREKSRRAPRGRAGKNATSPARRRKRATPTLEEVPPQGYESEDDAASGAVRPPGGAELLLTAAEVVGELAKAGISRSERLVKDALSRLPLS
jgi:hypothetical protein